MAPEIMAPPDLDDDSSDTTATIPFTPQSDTYSFGMTTLEIMTGQHPFSHIKLDSVVVSRAVRGERPKRPDNFVPQDLWNLLVKCWDQEPARRPTMHDVIAALLRLKSSQTFPFSDTWVGQVLNSIIKWTGLGLVASHFGLWRGR